MNTIMNLRLKYLLITGALMFFIGYIMKTISTDVSIAKWGENITIPGAILLILGLIFLLFITFKEEKKLM